MFSLSISKTSAVTLSLVTSHQMEKQFELAAKTA
jgi:hypothetical protein